MADRIVLNTISYHGHGAIENIVPELTARGYKKAFVCSDPDLIKFGVTGKITALLDAASFPYAVYSEIKPNPTIQNVQDGVAAFKAAEADCIVTIGGGSSMDTAKSIGIIVANPSFADVRSLEGVADTKNKSIPIFAVPTTAGTAAEVTINYVITDAEKNRKMVCVDPHDIPVVAFVDPDMMSSMPKGLTAATGMDALTHAVEAFIGRSTTPYTRKMVRQAVQLIHDNLLEAYEHGDDMRARRNMLSAAYKAGVAFTRSYVGYVHAIAHSLGGRYGIPHGLANAIILPHMLRAYGEAAAPKLADLARMAGIVPVNAQDSLAAEAFIDWIDCMNEILGIPKYVSGIRRSDIPEMAAHADAEANPLYPVPLLMDRLELERMYEVVAGGMFEDEN